MSSYQYAIEGGFPLKGRITASGNKNSALPCLAATLLTDQPVVLRNLPEIEDVHVMIEILKVLGCSVEKIGHNEYRFQSLDIKREEVPRTSPEDPRVHPPRRAAAGPQGPRPPAPSRRRRDRPEAAGHALSRPDGAGHPRGVRDFLRPVRQQAEGRRRSSWTRPPSPPRRTPHGSGAGGGHDRHRERRLRAARPGPVPDARLHGRAHHRHRIQHPYHVRA